MVSGVACTEPLGIESVLTLGSWAWTALLDGPACGDFSWSSPTRGRSGGLTLVVVLLVVLFAFFAGESFGRGWILDLDHDAGSPEDTGLTWNNSEVTRVVTGFLHYQASGFRAASSPLGLGKLAHSLVSVCLGAQHGEPPESLRDLLYGVHRHHLMRSSKAVRMQFGIIPYFLGSRLE